MKIKRLCFNKLWSEISVPEISILWGARQVGKSTLMRQIQAKAKREGLNTSFFDLEQPADLNRLAGSDDAVMKEITSGAKVVFIDEFHYLKNASKIFKAIYDSQQSIKIYASGSSSLEIHKHIKESLAGRFIRTTIFPLSIKEWKKISGYQPDAYFQWGGLPGLIHCASPVDRVALLENILSSYITKDIKGLIKEENIRSFNALLYLLAQSQGSVSVVSNLSRETGLSESTVVRHLEIISLTYALHVIHSYSNNLANELKKSKKFYFFDVGIRNMLLKDFRPIDKRDDKGIVYESAVLLHLQYQLKPNMEIRFWRTKRGEEVDFIVLKNRVPLPIEVKSHLSQAGIPKGMKLFLKKYAQAPYGIVFNASLQCQMECEERIVYFKHWTESSSLEYMQSVV